MTGFRTWRRGVSFRNESTIACMTIVGSKSARAFSVPAMSFVTSLRSDQVEMLDDRAKRQRPRDGQHRDDQPEAADEHADAERRVVEGRVRGEAGEGAAVVVGGGRERVEDLAEAVDPGVGDPGLARGGNDANGRA